MQRTPSVSRADVERIIRRDYSPHDFERVMEMVTPTNVDDLPPKLREFLRSPTHLETYGSSDWPPERDRVHLAALKLADGDAHALSDILRNDWRDLLAYAEYPGYMRNSDKWNRLSVEERQQIFDGDWTQYTEWLNRK